MRGGLLVLQSRTMKKDLIQLNGVTKRFEIGDSKVLAVDGVTLSIAEGDFVAITGPSGSGKSTLMNLVGGLDFPDKGSVVVSGLDLGDLSDEPLADYRNKMVGFVFQQFHLRHSFTVLENVMLPLFFSDKPREKREDMSRAAIRAVGLSQRIAHKAFQLSGGERQRVAIARAIVGEPKILIADEPTGNLDSENGAQIVGLLKELNEKGGITVIIVTHDASVAAQAQKRLAMRDGRLEKTHA